MVQSQGSFVFSDEGSIMLHKDEPCPGFHTISYEPADSNQGDALIVPSELFEKLCKLSISTPSSK